jgi:hypothetical protein
MGCSYKSDAQAGRFLTNWVWAGFGSEWQRYRLLSGASVRPAHLKTIGKAAAPV